MSKKRRAPKASPGAPAALIVARVERERAWAHALWMQRATYAQISAASALPVELGGIGVHVSHAGCKAMVAAYRESRGDVTMSREERLERQSDEIDELMRALRREIGEFVEREGSVPEKAVRLLLDAGKREAELHGLAAATKIDATVTHRDGVIDELNASLAALGRPAVEVDA
jgi:hypothetical protein